MKANIDKYNSESVNELKNDIVRYISFWPYLLVIIIISLITAYLYIRYTSPSYKSSAIIEILDESQNSEMALPTALTVFNRSMINLENEINRLQSYSLNQEVVKKTKSNIKYFQIGLIQTSQYTSETWFDDYDLEFKIDTDKIDKKFIFELITKNDKLIIRSYDHDGNFLKDYKFNSLSTLNINHELPFDININFDSNLSAERKMILFPVKDVVNNFRSQLQIESIGKDSDQLLLSLVHQNHKIAQTYINSLIFSFDQDGILDRELEYIRTIEFVNKREKILKMI